MDCVIASGDSADSGLLAIAGIVAATAAWPAVIAACRAAWAFELLPGRSVFPAASASGGYLAFTREGRSVPVRRRTPECCQIPATVGEACAVVLYGLQNAWLMPAAVTVDVSLLPHATALQVHDAVRTLVIIQGWPTRTRHRRRIA